MKTSSSQFDLMVTFMEQHGDLSKPSSNARGRISALKNWDELVQLLNSDGSGDTKTTEKWKKVWSDFKNNTKKKAARLHRAASGTGGGPAVHSKLTDLEQRVLNLIGVQVATGLAVEEAGLSQAIHIQPNSNVSLEQGIAISQPHQIIESPQHGNEPEFLMRAVSSPPFAFVEEEVQSSLPRNEPMPSTSIAPALSPPQARPSTAPLSSFVEVQLEDTGILSPTRPSTQVHVVQPGTAPSGQTTPRRSRLSRRRGSPRGQVRPARTEQAAQHFLQAEEFWREFKAQQHNDYMDMRREQSRIREMEVQAQREWQAVGLRALDILDKLVNKYCKD